MKTLKKETHPSQRTTHKVKQKKKHTHKPKSQKPIHTQPPLELQATKKDQTREPDTR